ncbi:MAG: hypothetical protein M0O94_03605 [Bacteroidales bacterium]|nr:hypothetical protein [Bacteroidales bacterium]MDD2322782.1 hypothetical protein [Bacteroidales bacterium]MDD3961083.1 hypothetical protein [Bacteroidales bacterium]MDY0284805.1 hypothetical protein [Bacteroidales bacterium]
MKTRILLLLLVLHGLTQAQWTTDTLINTLISSYTNGAVSKVVPTTDHHYYVSYYGSMYNGYHMNLQLLNYEGNNLWAENGITVSSHPQDSWITEYDLGADKENNAILAFPDVRSGNPDIYAYKINPEGEFLWGNNGIALSQSPEAEYSPQLCVLSDNAVIITWAVNETLRVQKILPDGTLAWGLAGLTITEPGKTWGWPVAIPHSDGGFYLAYFKQTGSFPAMQRQIFVNRYAADGSALWAQEVEICGFTGITAWDQMNARPDGNDGIMLFWRDDRDGDMLADVAVQKVDEEGILAYIPNGVELASDELNCFYPVASCLANGAVVAFFTKTDGSQNYRGLFAQKLDPYGDKLWGANGKELLPLSTTFNYSIAAQTADDKLFCLYSRYPEGLAINDQLLIYGLNDKGAALWDSPLMLAAGTYDKVHPWLSEVHENQFITSWERGTDGLVTAQNFSIYGGTGVLSVANPAPVSNGKLIRISKDFIVSNGKSISSLRFFDSSGKLISQVSHPRHTESFPSGYRGVLFIVATNPDGLQQTIKTIRE